LKVRIQIDGHRHYEEIEGEVLWWGQTVESFDGQWMPVPCVAVQTGDEVQLVSLKRQYASARRPIEIQK
jgi:hypothetical protein